MSARLSLMIAAVSGMLAVALGAFAAHALRAQLSERYYDIWQTAVQYQMFHTLALLAVGIMLERHSRLSLRLAAWLFSGGMLLFCGSLYMLAFTGITTLGMITPLGGCLFLAGWLMLALAVFRAPEKLNDC
ncbi:DUF423 domain-containing protein [Aliamphritea spongicola]|uniref:DUF423 domain-containing protein n=1 Tax=Aliamphritea spongicola TaxID=707589 RepID=UPI00196A3590|nr:DUF423 domain-containing protein [Aliamphritea spongicola]MBN3562363.1 DUF423 domain-containing protein [Aliamphritea spongicola]